MADINIKAGITVDTGDAAAGLKDVQGQLEKTGKAVKDVDGNTSAATGKFSKLKEGLTDMSPALGGVVDGVGKVGSAFKALLLNPVGFFITAIVAGLTFLFKAFASTREGGDKLAQGFAYLTGAFDKVLEVAGSFVNGLSNVKESLGKVAAFLANPIAGFKSLAKEVNAAAIATANLKAEQQKLERDKIENMATNKDLIKQEEALKNIRDNEFLSTKERIKANESAAAIEEKRLKTLEDLQLREVARLKKSAAIKGGESKLKNDELKELRTAELELADIREESIGRQNEFLTNRFGLQKEQEDKDKEARAIAAENAYQADVDKLARQKEMFDKEYQLELEHQLRRKKLQGMTASEMAEQQRIADEADTKRRDEHFAKFIETKKINDTVIVQATLSSLAAETIAKQQAQVDELLILEARKAAQLDFAGAFSNVLSSIGGLLEQGTAASKVAAIAEIGLGTATGFINGLDIAQKSAKGTGPAAAFAFPIFYATQVAAILTAVGKAKNALSQVKGGGGGSVSVSAPSIQTVQAPVLPQQSSTSLNASSIQAVGNAASGGVNRSFVLDADINNAADRAARLNRAARLG